ncbi:tetratricopeptide repeat protein [Aeromonas caviae]|uniref:tetratricopeptide repeat protein n=1 Tax=Aeromonas caviae TaxID=648 RepID=UPI0038CFF1DF
MDKSELPEEIIVLIKKAEDGDPKAQFKLGQKYRLGQGLTKSDSMAVEWYRKSAEQNYPSGQNAMGQMCRHGLGVEQNYSEAITWFQKAIEQKLAVAMSNLGVMYQFGQGVEQNYEEAFSWFNKSLEHGYKGAKFYLGWMYSHGLGMDVNKNEAIKWYTDAAEDGDSYAQFNLGMIYMHGLGVEINYNQAHDLFQKAAISTLSGEEQESELHFKSIEFQDHVERLILSPEITQTREKILEQLRVDTRMTLTMTHYTSLMAGSALLLKKSPLRLGHINSLNDPNEGKLLWRYLDNEPVEGKPAFVGCYLLDDDSLNMWRFYSKNHHNEDACGCAITFNTKNFFNFSLLPESSIDTQQSQDSEMVFSNTGKYPQESAAFYRIIYIGDNMSIHDKDKDILSELFSKLKDEVDNFIRNTQESNKLQQLSKLLGPLPYLLKDADYEAEKEHRIIVTHLEYGAKEIQTMEPVLENGIPQTSPRLYLELHRASHLEPVKHVTLGPKSPHQEMMAPYWHHKLASDFPDQLKAKPDFYVRTSRCAYK